MNDLDFFKISGANDKLRGVVVFVHPELLADPLGKRNQVGVICEADIALDNIYVDFRDKTGLFSADALFTFLPSDHMQDNLVNMLHNKMSSEFKALQQVELLVRYGDVTEKIKAMQTARDHPAIQPMCVEILKDQISRDIFNQYER
ncbi:hypothetical protein SNE25_13080 [Mucilaginibacter sabulilitoris]|uniref:Uncharacterized protein n=1 Tax=Mucilaginibacter sabulilitoris TaxID=1173583 RepID=A0ABZ0TXC8_9SPHI|nr:hypothetical protein [Mucilaginibacter sabulilitoris]WPU96454.1 hypothetical protein SNE25_13080 [Mucilaginibacter sabulilitoris]